MNHNKYNLKEGETVILDAGYNNSSEVVIISFTPNEMFARIKDENSDWEVMTNRLSPLASKGE